MRSRRASGISLVEIVVTLSIVGILALIAVPRFLGTDAFRSRGFYDQATETVRYAQKISVAWREQVCVTVSAAAITATGGAGCATQLLHPVSGAPLTATAPSGVTLAGPSFSFTAPTATTAGGRPNPDAQVTITINSTIAGDLTRRIVVERETGYVHN